MASGPNDIWNKLMGLAFIGVIICGVLMFVGPKDDSGHVPIWWYFLMSASTLLFAIGNVGARKYRK